MSYLNQLKKAEKEEGAPAQGAQSTDTTLVDSILIADVGRRAKEARQTGVDADFWIGMDECTLRSEYQERAVEWLLTYHPGCDDDLLAGYANLANGNDFAVARKLRSAPSILKAVNQEYAWIEDRERVARFDGGELTSYSSKSGFITTLGNKILKKKTKLGAGWLASEYRRTYRDVGLYPDGNVPSRHYNLWRGFAVQPRAGDWSLMRAHIRDVVAAGIPELDEYIIRWTAWGFQNPGKRAEAALAMLGIEGCGKGTYGNALGKIYGKHSLHITSPKLFASGDFNAHLQRAIFLFADECHWPGDKQYEGQLKGMITESTMMIEPKGIDAYEVPNLLRVLISTNDDWAVPASLDARRFVVTNVSSHRTGDKAYFDALMSQMDRGGYEAMLYDLQRMPLGGWHPRQVIETEALRQQKECSLSLPQEWLLSVLESGVLPKCTVFGLPAGFVATTEGIEPALEKHMKGKGKVPAGRALGTLLRTVGAVSDNAPNKARTRGWQFPSLVEARAAWDKRYYPRAWDAETIWR